MPFVKPETLLQLQIAASSPGIEAYNDSRIDITKIRGSVSMCIVCGDATCDKTPVHVNGVFVHREDAEEADPVEVPNL